MKVSTFYHLVDGDGAIEGVIVKGPSASGLCVLHCGDLLKLARHVSQLTPLDDEARELIQKYRETHDAK